MIRKGLSRMKGDSEEKLREAQIPRFIVSRSQDHRERQREGEGEERERTIRYYLRYLDFIPATREN